MGNEGKSKLSGGAATESGYMWDYFLDISSLVSFRYFVCIVLYLEIYCSFIFEYFSLIVKRCAREWIIGFLNIQRLFIS